MLEDYKDSQKRFYDEITHSVSNGKISHAYFIETSSFANGKDLALALAKFLLCRDSYLKDSGQDALYISNLIDQGVYSNLILVEPDGLWIKKEQLQMVKEKFSTKSIDGNYQIYLINQADKLNKAAANSILKFLEEPDDGVIAILVADNRYNVLNTILSRCQVYSLESDKDEDKINDIEHLIDFLMNLERNNTKVICYTQDLWHNLYKTKDEVKEAFSNLEKLYMDILNFKISNITRYDEFIDDIKFIADANTENDIVRKISVITKIKNLVQTNANLNLLIDRFIIEYCGVM